MRLHVPAMRRSIISLSLLLAAAVAAIWVLDLTGAASASPRAAHIICPQQAPRVTSCCPLPPQPAGIRSSSAPTCCPPPAADATQPQLQPICCGTAPCCTTACCTTTCCTTACCAPTPCGPGSVTIAASPNPSRAGQKVVISGTVAGTSVAGTQVVLWRKLARQSSFHQVSQTTTDSTGRYTFTMQRGSVMADQEFYVASNGAQSSTVQQQVAALIGLASSARSVTMGHAIVLHGHVTPSHAGEVVLVEVSRGGAWHVLARPRLGRRSSYSLSLLPKRSGTAKLRVVLNTDSRNERSISRTVTVSVAP